MIDRSKVEVVIAAANLPRVAGGSTMVLRILALTEEEQLDLAGLAYFGDGGFENFGEARHAAGMDIIAPEYIEEELVEKMGEVALARDLRTGLALLREDRE